MRFVAGALAAIGLAALFGAADAQTRPAALIDCAGKPALRPAEVVLTCADAGITAQRLTWTGWGEPFAAAVGEASVNLCTPNCAAGRFQSYKVVLVARGRRRCANAVAYDTVAYAYLGAAPPGAAGMDTTVTYRCR